MAICHHLEFSVASAGGIRIGIGLSAIAASLTAGVRWMVQRSLQFRGFIWKFLVRNKHSDYCVVDCGTSIQNRHRHDRRQRNLPGGGRLQETTIVDQVVAFFVFIRIGMRPSLNIPFL